MNSFRLRQIYIDSNDIDWNINQFIEKIKSSHLIKIVNFEKRYRQSNNETYYSIQYYSDLTTYKTIYKLYVEIY